MSSSLTFGYVDKDENSPSKTFTIKNRGQKHLKLTRVSITPTSLKDKVTVTPSLTDLSGMIIEPDGYVTVTVRVAPTDFDVFKVDLKVQASGLTEAEVDATGIESRFAAPGWSSTQGLSVVAAVSSGDGDFYDTSGNIMVSTSPYDFHRVSSTGMHRMTFRVKKNRGTGPMIINSWSLSSGTGTPKWSVTKQTYTNSSEFPITLNNNGDYKDFTIRVQPTDASEMHSGAVTFSYYELGQTKSKAFALMGRTIAQQANCYGYLLSVGETVDLGQVGQGSTNRASAIIYVENVGDMPLNVSDIWLSTSPSSGGTRRTSIDGGNNDTWRVVTTVSKVNPGLAGGFVVQVENTNTRVTLYDGGVTRYPTSDVYVYIESDSDTGPIQRVKMQAKIVK